jgi:hypothetical protein
LKGREVVGPGYSRAIDVAAKAIDKRENSGYHNRVNWVSKTDQHYPSWVKRVSPNNSMDQWTDRVSQNSNTDRLSDRVGQVTWVSPNSSTDRRTN